MRLAPFRALLLIAACLLSEGCRTTAVESPAAAKLEALFAGLHERGLFDGAVVIGERDRIVWEKGFGYANIEREVPFTPDTPTDSGSLAKTLTASLVIALHDEGALDLDAPAQRLLPELPYREITLRHLLSHSSGIPVLDYDWFDRFLAKDEIRTTERLLSVLGKERPPLAFAPGTSFEYSSFGFDLAALAAARAARKSYGDLLGERIFRPLGVSSAFLRPARLSEFPSPRTLAYRRANGKVEVHDVFDFEAFHGGSNIYISAHDLHRWNASFLTRPLLGKTALASALEPARIGAAPSGLTLGSWYRAPDGSAFWYSGHLQGFHNEVFRSVRSGRSIVYVSNNTIEPWLQKGLIRAVNQILDGGDPPHLVKPLVAAVRPEDRDALAGRWLLDDGASLTVEITGGRTTVTRDGVTYRMVQVDPSFFYVPGLDPFVAFAKGVDRGFATIFVGSNLDEQRGTRDPRPGE